MGIAVGDSGMTLGDNVVFEAIFLIVELRVLGYSECYIAETVMHL